MNIYRIGIMIAVTAIVAIGQTSPVGSVKLGKLTWTKENINIETPDSWCYDNKPANCAKLGRLYTWEAAKKACASMGGKWRLPTREDWNYLINFTGGEEVAAGRLKSKTGWACEGDGTDDYGFTARPGGRRDYRGKFIGTDSSGRWWSADEYKGGGIAWGGYAYYRYIGYAVTAMPEYDYDQKDGFSVRCVTP